MLKPILLFGAGSLLVLAPLAIAGRGASQDQSQPAAAPEPPNATAPMAAGMKNPVKPTAESQAKAKSLYSMDCALCHGDNGNGKTDLAASMGLTLDDFSDPKTLAGRGDGELFNVIRNGKGKMPAEDKSRARDSEVWNIILYLRSFAKAAPAAPTPAPAAPPAN